MAYFWLLILWLGWNTTTLSFKDKEDTIINTVLCVKFQRKEFLGSNLSDSEHSSGVSPILHARGVNCVLWTLRDWKYSKYVALSVNWKEAWNLQVKLYGDHSIVLYLFSYFGKRIVKGYPWFSYGRCIQWEKNLFHSIRLLKITICYLHTKYENPFNLFT